MDYGDVTDVGGEDAGAVHLTGQALHGLVDLFVYFDEGQVRVSTVGEIEVEYGGGFAGAGLGAFQVVYLEEGG